jgi:hypothetical protein
MRLSVVHHFVCYMYLSSDPILHAVAPHVNAGSRSQEGLSDVGWRPDPHFLIMDPSWLEAPHLTLWSAVPSRLLQRLIASAEWSMASVTICGGIV